MNLCEIGDVTGGLRAVMRGALAPQEIRPAYGGGLAQGSRVNGAGQCPPASEAMHRCPGMPPGRTASAASLPPPPMFGRLHAAMRSG